MPGTLPVPNREAIRMVIRTALALNCQIPHHSVFHRKNYFYPDLPKGYQVSQYGEFNPLGYHGWLDVPLSNGDVKKIHIRRVHLEEDTGKLMHLPSGGSGVDYNRAGVPLMEIVTGFPPDIHNGDAAKEYLVQLRNILLYLGVCDGKLEEGSMRCEPNISVRLDSTDVLGTKTELKNLNSFRSVQLGIAFETRRQVAVIESGAKVLQETRGWNDSNETSFSMRTKESENDYRYFPCPDLVPMEFSEADIEEIRQTLPEMPLAKFQRYQSSFGLSGYDAQLLVSDRAWAEFFEQTVELGGDPKLACNWMNADFARFLNETGQRVASADAQHGQTKVTPAHIVDLLKLITSDTINGKMAKEVFKDVFETGEFPSSLVEKRGATQISDSDAIVNICRSVIDRNADVVAKYRSGQTNVLGFLVGQVMKQSQGRANPKMVNEIMAKVLGDE